MKYSANTIRQKGALAAIAVIFSLLCYGQVNNTYNLMPAPFAMQAVTTGRIAIDKQFRVAISGSASDRIYAEASRFIRRLSNKTGIFLDKQEFVTRQQDKSTATLLVTIQRNGLLKLGEDESYAIETSGRQVLVTAVTDLGAIHALETLIQLVSTDAAGYYIPAVSVKDHPRFAWRGLLLDVALHFMPVEVVERTLDGMAAVKMNVLHLHLCNDQGFRVESKVFPRLQQVASDGIYYTQEDIKTIIKYASQRGIRVVPEFVVPAHTTAILTAYPELASVKRNYSLQRYFGVFDPVLDPTNEKVYPFLEKLFTEMASLFPDEYFHIGGDENTGKDWEAVPHIKKFMQTHGMKTTMDLQTYFNQRLLPIIRKAGKKMMGWDEVFHPGLPKEIVIQSWRGNESFYSSVKQGYKAILSYGYYIDLIQPASYHYQNDPIPDSVKLTPDEQKLILGGEATMWSELVTPVTVDSRIWPRTAAIAERLWSPKAVTDTDDMYRRLDMVSLQLESLGLQHLTYKPAMMRQLCNGNKIKALEVLVAVLEPLKIYDRNEGDTMYTVFSPFTKIADVATPDQPLPRIFNKSVQQFLMNSSSGNEKEITDQLILWKENDAAFKQLLANSPVLQEAASLSQHLSLLAEAGLKSIEYIKQHKTADDEWLKQQRVVVKHTRMQGGRCEIQVVDAIQKLITAAAGKQQ
ncbi:family 20 glycosylhydrolase [Ferruginibacter paludis]|uniref:beta-N-acetylhexosaminidase n=1 Tax=Ferruginibacter paludis TaxID=1310417 RepID=UPI0025B29EDB|nr:family 20 glycosylhydrolase [Ferruginibacter paludis]MDN3659421.1 family 20 glycosylhydrolase [Ferruginibacter paludis]